MPAIAILGASNNRGKFSNKAVRAYQKLGWTVYPVNPKEEEVEGLKVYRSVKEIPEPLERVTLYLPPHVGMEALADIATIKPKDLFINPGADSPELMEKAKQLGLNVIFGCAITDVGESPAAY